MNAGFFLCYSKPFGYNRVALDLSIFNEKVIKNFLQRILWL